MDEKLEIRSIEIAESKTELTDTNEFVGYAVPWSQKSRVITDKNGQKFREIINPDAFNKHLDERDIYFCVGHDSKDRFGRTSKGTLQLTPDKYGLQFRLKLPNTTRAKDLAEEIRAGEYDGMSIGFYINKRSIQREGTFPTQVVEEGELEHIALARTPAYSATRINVRELENELNESNESNEGGEEKVEEEKSPIPPIKLLGLYS